ncbi:MAG: arginine--tRNA ligase [Bacilli bacterium]|nr:arginine--tRNA ligase [Bacilli bacterium]MDY6363120.1 arginine--tRNA ligase [Bacilli bacterium]
MMNIEQNLKDKIVAAASKLGVVLTSNDVIIEKSKAAEHGDYASNVALKNAGKAGKNPRQFASELIEAIDKDGISKIEIAGPGFINFFMNNDAMNAIVKKIIDEGDNYGRGEKKNFKINVEFVSANPTGDLHLGHARCAAVGDSICRIYQFAGYDVTREFYVNNAGNQIATLGKSLDIRLRQLKGEKVELPEDSYHAQDIVDIAKQFDQDFAGKYNTSAGDYLKTLTEYGMKKELEKIEKDLALFRTKFDIYSFETDVRKDNHVQKVLESKFAQYSYQQDGATFLRTTDFLDDKDRAVVKSDGSYTYFMPDICYHLIKLSRGYDLLVDVLGADHYGYINRMKSALMMQGYSKETLEVELVQIVRLIKDGKEVKMSKRTGAGISLRELCEEVGVDAARYFFVSRAASSHLDFDLNLALEQSSSNPVYYAQYAHARLSKVLELAKDLEIDENAAKLGQKQEMDLLKTLIEFPKTIENAAKNRGPHIITTYIQDLASKIHAFYTECRVIDREHLDVTASRLALAKASRIVMKNALNVIGVSAPDAM